METRTPQTALAADGALAAPRRGEGAEALRVLVCRAGGGDYAFAAGLVGQIVPPEGLLPVPGAPSFVAGTVKWRGMVVAVADLCARLGHAPCPRAAGQMIVIVRLAGGPAGFLVDGARELLWVKAADIQPPSRALVGAAAPFVQGVAHLDRRVLVLLDPQRLFSADDGEDLAALARAAATETACAGQPREEALPVAPEVIRLLTFSLGGGLYGLDLHDVAEVSVPLPLTPLPRVEAHVLGLVNLRGQVIPVMDLARRLAVAGGTGPDHRLIVLKGGAEGAVALRVDAVRGLVEAPRAAAQPPEAGAAYQQALVRLDEGLLVQLDAAALLIGLAPRREGPA